jgi:ABC-2 type transport system permease protein
MKCSLAVNTLGIDVLYHRSNKINNQATKYFILNFNHIVYKSIPVAFINQKIDLLLFEVVLHIDKKINRLHALLVKEMYQIFRDPSSLLICFVLPTILMFLYGYGISLDMNHIPIGVALEDTSSDAQSFAEALMNSRYFKVNLQQNRHILNDEMIRGRLRGVVVIPTYFSLFKKQKTSIAPIQVLSDGTEPNMANFLQNYVQGVWMNWMQQESMLQDMPESFVIKTQVRFWYNEELESRNFLIPGSLAIIMTLIGTLLTALVVAREWERGTMESLMATTVTIGELLVGKLAPYFILGMVSMGLCTAVAIFYYHIPFRGSFMALMIISSVFLLSALGLGLLISTIARNQFVAAQSAMVAAFLPGFILSGFIFEIASMPLPIQWITQIIPARYFVSSLQTIFLVGNVWTLLIPNMIYMGLIATVFFILLFFKTSKRLD